MAARTKFEEYLAEEVRKVKGTYYPVRAGFLRRVFIKSASPRKLHPNPDDEFCMPEIGPNLEIMHRYQTAYMELWKTKGDLRARENPVLEPLEVEKTRPDGYMILNGHHRWGGAIQAGLKTVKIKIVDLTQKSDILSMMKASSSDRRVTLDLDEVVFRPDSDPYLEKELPFPLRRFYRERLRRGIPALFHKLTERKYDIWIYTARNYSLNYLRYYFKHYHVRITGIVTGTARKGPSGADTRKEVERLCSSKYTTTIHISNDAIVRTHKGSQDFEEIRLNGSSDTWSLDVTNALEEMMKHA